MIKKNDIRASLDSALNLAEAVESLGGKCTIASCAEKLNKRIGGSFSTLVGATIKFGLIERKKGNLILTKEYESMKVAYNEEERLKSLRKFFFNVELFKEIYERYKNVELPIKIFDKILIREFQVDKKLSSRVSKYFINGAKQIKILKDDNTFKNFNLGKTSYENAGNLSKHSFKDIKHSEGITINISGKGMNHELLLEDEDDFNILNVILNKARKKVMEEGIKDNTENENSPENSFHE